MERRQNKRIKIDKECVLYYGSYEYDAIVNNISEEGVCIKIEGNVDIKPKNTVSFQFCDDIKSLDKHTIKEYVIIASANVIRRDYKNGFTYLGCKVRDNKELRTYVIAKDISLFVDSLKSGIRV